MLLLIDNYDSFVFNLARYFAELGFETKVVRNDGISLDEIADLSPDAIVLSPGPCSPSEAGVCVPSVKKFGGVIPILGVCLGHQAIGAAFGADIVLANEPVHGRTSRIYHDESELFNSLPNPFIATRYHSLVIDEAGLAGDVKVMARTSDQTPMVVSHSSHCIVGTQFHPESILTEHGHQLLANFLSMAGLLVPGSMPNAEWRPPDLSDDSEWPVVPF